jgi:hypothetical protein
MISILPHNLMKTHNGFSIVLPRGFRHSGFSYATG